MRAWVLLIYKIPAKPTSSRVYIWRKLKKSGAVLWHDAVWILPATPKNIEHFQWLAAEITELSGEAHVWRADALFVGQEQSLISTFNEQSEQAYRDIKEAILRGGTEWSDLSRQYQHAVQQDYFQSELGIEVRELLMKARGGSIE